MLQLRLCIAVYPKFDSFGAALMVTLRLWIHHPVEAKHLLGFGGKADLLSPPTSTSLVMLLRVDHPVLMIYRFARTAVKSFALSVSSIEIEGVSYTYPLLHTYSQKRKCVCMCDATVE